MAKNYFIFALCFFFLILTSCYTITHPDPCPGLVELDTVNDLELSSIVNN